MRVYSVTVTCFKQGDAPVSESYSDILALSADDAVSQAVARAKVQQPNKELYQAVSISTYSGITE